jgi:hypothetical protein
LIRLNRFLSTTITSPLWLRHRCGHLFTSILIDKDQQGIRRLFQIILDCSSDDRVHNSLAKILSTCPKELTPDIYVQSIRSQLIELLRHSRYMPIMCLAINQLFQKYPTLIEHELFTILFEPLNLSHRSSSTCIATEEQWEVFLNDLEHLTRPVSNEPIRVHVKETYLNGLLNIYLASEKSLSSFKERYFQILIHLFSSIDDEKTLAYFEEILCRMTFLPVKFVPEQSSGFSLIIDSNPEIHMQLCVRSISKLLFAIEHNDRLIVRLCLHLLQLLVTKNDSTCAMIWTENESQLIRQQYIIMDVLKEILEYLTEHINMIIDNIDDTIRVVQVIENIS